MPYQLIFFSFVSCFDVISGLRNPGCPITMKDMEGPYFEAGKIAIEFPIPNHNQKRL